MVFDCDKNMFLFEREMHPTNIEERFKLKLIGCVNMGEEVLSASYGSLSISYGNNEPEEVDSDKQKIISK